MADMHRKDILSILTEEQKKYIESHKEITAPFPESGK
jgi:hypothetical protein